MILVEILSGIFCLSIVVLIHETGHYISARLRGIKVLTFSIGFGPRLFGITRQGTDFRLSLIPLGGYCRFYGDMEFQKALREKRELESLSKHSFYSATPFSKIIVSVWGPMANVIFSLILFFFIAWIGYEEFYSEPRILLASNWNKDGNIWPADEAGLKDGDHILTVNGNEIKRFSDLRSHYSYKSDKEIKLQILRDSELIDIIVKPRLKNETAILGVLNWLDPVIEEVKADSAANKAGLIKGDRILSLNDQKIKHTVALSNLLKETRGKLAEIEIERNASFQTLKLYIPEDMEIGLTFRYLKKRSEKLNPVQAMVRSFKQTWDTIFSTFSSIKMLFLGYSLNNSILGPIRLINDTGIIIAKGFKRGLGAGFLWTSELIALISLSLALINLFPIPVLDGGQILLFIVEALHRKPLRARTIYRYQVIGAIIVLIIAFTALTNDLIYISGR